MSIFGKLQEKIAPVVVDISALVTRSRLGGPKVVKPLFRILRKRAAYLPIERWATTRDGFKLPVTINQLMDRELFFFGEWEPLFTRYMQDREKTDGIFLDCGSNIGYYTMIGSKRFEHVHAIEASPRIASRLSDILNKNSVKNVTVHNVAIGEELGELEFFYDEKMPVRSSFFPTKTSVPDGRVSVLPLVEILDGIDTKRIEFIKLDIEGFEASILSQIFDMKDSMSPKLEIVVEFSQLNKVKEGAQPSWPMIKKMIDRDFDAFILEESYNIDEYIDLERRSSLKKNRARARVFL